MNNSNIFSNITIGFWTPQLDVRGSCDALYHYAHYFEKILGGKSVIIIPENNNSINITPNNEKEGIEKFEKRFSIFKHNTLENLDDIILKENITILYLIKYGKNDNIYSRIIPNIIHCVFDLSEPHGKVYIAVSEQLANKYNQKEYLPHMIGLVKTTDENLRKELNIPEKSIVIGRHGGMDTFNLDFVKTVIQMIVRERDDIYFLFANTPEFDKHKQIIHVPRFSDTLYKQKFINTCDAYIEAGVLGHSFGIAQGEFSVFHKPLIMYGGAVWNDSHRKIVGCDGIYYYNNRDLYDIIVNFEKNKKYPNCYTDFTPEKIMEKFKEIVLKCLN